MQVEWQAPRLLHVRLYVDFLTIDSDSVVMSIAIVKVENIFVNFDLVEIFNFF